MTLIACLHTEAILRLDALIEGSRSVTVAAHTHPDGDALGSVSALVCYLRQRRGKDAVAVLSDSPAPSVRTIIPDGAPFLFQDREPEECLARIAGSDLLFLLDCNGFSRTEIGRAHV